MIEITIKSRDTREDLLKASEYLRVLSVVAPGAFNPHTGKPLTPPIDRPDGETISIDLHAIEAEIIDGTRVPTPPIDRPDGESTPVDSIERTPTPVDTIETANGIPWDERIHASSKAKTGGNWRRRRNTPDATFEAVMAEIRASIATPPPPPPPPPPTGDTADVPAPPPPPPTGAIVPENMSFAILADYVTKRLTTGTLTGEQLVEHLPEGVTAFTAMAGRSEDEMKTVYTKLETVFA